MTQLSLLAAYVAGMVALFAPCCVSYLFPAYLGNVIKERRRVLLMTFIYSLGIFVVMLPIVLGAKMLSNAFMNWHDETYLVGSILMVIVAGFTFIGYKLPMPNVSLTSRLSANNGVDIPSTFGLGIVAGITSSCCAPVLLGVLTLSSFSPSLGWALLIGFSYVLGMVSPLYAASWVIKDHIILRRPILKKKLTTITIGNAPYPIFVSNIVGGSIFLISGLIMFGLTLAGKVQMPGSDDQSMAFIHDVAWKVSDLTGGIPFINLLFVALMSVVFWQVGRQLFAGKSESNTPPQPVKKQPSCCSHADD